jgi:hypothetical protein
MTDVRDWLLAGAVCATAAYYQWSASEQDTSDNSASVKNGSKADEQITQTITKENENKIVNENSNSNIMNVVSINDIPSTPEVTKSVSKTKTPPSTSSKHGFDIDDDVDDDDLIRLPPLPRRTSSSESSRHGFYDYIEDNSDEDDHTSLGSPESKVGGTTSRFGPGRRNFELTLMPRKEKASPNPNLNQKRNAFTASSSSSYRTRADSESQSENPLAELRELSKRLSIELARRDSDRENEIKQVMQCRTQLMEADAEKQKQLLERFKNEELRVQQERENAKQQIDSLLHSSSSYTIDIASGFLERVSSGAVPVSSGVVTQLERLVNESNELIENLQELLAMEEGLDEADLERFDIILKDPLTSRLLSGGNTIIQNALDLYRRESDKAAQARIALEEISLPKLPLLEKLQETIQKLANKKCEAPKVLKVGFDVMDVLMDSGVKLTKKQRNQLWKTVFKGIVDAAASAKTLQCARNCALLVFSTYYLSRHEGNAAFKRMNKVFLDSLQAANPIFAATFVTDEKEKANVIRGGNLCNLATMYSALVSLDSKKSESTACCWSWLVHTVQMLQKAALRSAELKDAGVSSNVSELLAQNVVDCATVLFTFLRTSGGMLISKRYKHLFFGNEGILAAVRLSVQSMKIYLNDNCYTAENRNIFEELEKFLEESWKQKALLSMNKDSQLESTHLLEMFMLSDLADNAYNTAMVLMAKKELEDSIPVLSEAVNGLQSSQKDMCIELADACESLTGLLIGCKVTLSSTELKVLATLLKRVIELLQTLHLDDSVRSRLQIIEGILSKGFSVDATAEVESEEVCDKLEFLTDSRNKLQMFISGNNSNAATDDVTQLLTTVYSMLNKTNSIDRITNLVDLLLHQKDHILKFALGTIAKSIARKCKNSSGKEVLMKLSQTIRGVIVKTQSKDFVIFMRAELQRVSPFVVPLMGTQSVNDDDWKGALGVYALCSIEDGDGLTISTPEDAWTWLATAINWCRAQNKDQQPKACLDMYVINVLNFFLRIVAPRMAQLYGNHFQSLLQAILTSVVPLVKKEKNTKGQLVDDKLSEFLREVNRGVYMSNWD